MNQAIIGIEPIPIGLQTIVLPLYYMAQPFKYKYNFIDNILSAGFEPALYDYQPYVLPIKLQEDITNGRGGIRTHTSI